VPIRHESDVVIARRKVRELAQRQGLCHVDVEALATAVTELTRNILVHASSGELLVRCTGDEGRRGVLVIARDQGPGIADLQQAMRDGYSSGSGLGLGLPSAQRLCDEFAIESKPGDGTIVTLCKWARD
jgi:serine/threonine-protein kinase RsbT